MPSLYTRRGDTGDSDVGGGRQRKDAPILEAVGAIDEANAAVGTAQAQALRRELIAFRKSGKKSFCHIATASTGSYLLASACSEVSLHPAGGLELLGPAAQFMHFHGLLKKVGVTFQELRMGRYKSALESYTRDEPSEPVLEEMHAILDRTTGSETPEVQPVMGKERILAMRKVVRDVAVAHHVKDYAIRVLEATHPDRPSAPEKVQRFVRFGGSPRGAQALLLAAKIHALMDGRFAAAIDDVRWAVKPALRHRIILNFEGEAEGVRPDAVLDDILASVPESIK